MRRKLISLLAVFTIICLFVGFQFVYADTINNKVAKSNVLSSSSMEILKNNNFDLNIDLTKITFENFEIELSSNVNLGNPIIDTKIESDGNTQTQTSKDLQTDSDLNNNLFKITANKTELNLDALTMVYSLPETINVGTNIQFILKATSTEEGENADDTVIEDSITFTVVENSNKEDSNIGNTNNENKPFDNSSNFANQTNSYTGLGNMQNFSVDLENSSISSTNKSTTQISGMSTNSISGSNSQSVTYEGSSNNYLSSLTVEGYSFENNFSKTTSTYFITISPDTTLLNITAETEDSSATICVYGDTDLGSGLNKVLVSVTAEDGSVRTYRIYVTV